MKRQNYTVSLFSSYMIYLENFQADLKEGQYRNMVAKFHELSDDILVLNKDFFFKHEKRLSLSNFQAPFKGDLYDSDLREERDH